MDTNEKNITPKRSGLSARLFLIYTFVLIFGCVVFGQTVYLQVSDEGKSLLDKTTEAKTRIRTIEATRGRILDCNGKELAVNIPWYDVYMDVANENITKEVFNNNVSQLSKSLSDLFKNKTAKEYEKMLRNARQKGSRYLLIKRNVNHEELEKLKTFPIFNQGRNKGGLIAERKEKRLMPYGNIAKRTIGYKTDSIFVGMEGAFNQELQGVDGQIFEYQKAKNLWISKDHKSNIEPQNGKDVVSTLNAVIQDVAHKSLLQILKKYKAEEGCVVLMEVATGNVVALVNLQRNSDSSYSERYNIAVGSAIEPGSTFKTPSLMVALEDGKIKPTDIYEVKRFATYANRQVEDSHYDGDRKMTVQQIFEESSNVGTTKIIWDNYHEKPQQFIDGLYKMSLNDPLNIPIAGAAKPYIKDTKDKTWSKVSLPWMSFGYELLITPLQMATFYNAIANNGCMVNPRFVTEIRDGQQVVKEFPVKVINPKICSEQTLKEIQMMLKGVVTDGTAREGFKNAPYTAAGKTGTSQIAEGGSYKGDKVKYNASFCGYFPAENPRYTCMILIRKTERRQYAAAVAVPVFRDIADKVCATHTDLMDATKPLKPDSTIKNVNFTPTTWSGNTQNLTEIYKSIGIIIQDQTSANWAVSSQLSDNLVSLEKRSFQSEIVPEVRNMSATDAVFLLEKCGYKAVIQGFGRVKEQSVSAGTALKKGTTITLILK